jgi:lipid A disaccharide synthetase
MDKLVVKEFIQNEMNATNLRNELHELLENNKRLQQLQKDYSHLKEMLSRDGNASAKAAKAIVNAIKKGHP